MLVAKDNIKEGLVISTVGKIGTIGNIKYVGSNFVEIRFKEESGKESTEFVSIDFDNITFTEYVWVLGHEIVTPQQIYYELAEYLARESLLESVDKHTKCYVTNCKEGFISGRGAEIRTIVLKKETNYCGDFEINYIDSGLEKWKYAVKVEN